MQASAAYIEQLKSEVKHSVDVHEHWGRWDAWLYNGGTVVVLLCTTLATLIPVASTSLDPWVAPGLTAFATFWVALDRALAFGPRWRFHIVLRTKYRRILDRVSFYPHLPEAERMAHLKESIEQLELARREESGIPGIGVGQEGSAGAQQM